jgi:hypothetical protein
MSAGATVAIIVVIVIIIAVAAFAAMAARRRRLKERFGPEYDRLVADQQSQRKAEAELASRERRVRRLDIRPLSAAARAEYATQWTSIQERFVDHPASAVSQAQQLVTAVLGDRGYPTEGYEQVLADLSVEHARNLEHYRAANALTDASANGQASTEDLRQAMIHYREMFDDLLDDSAHDDSAHVDAAHDDSAHDDSPHDDSPHDDSAYDDSAYDDSAYDDSADDDSADVTGTRGGAAPDAAASDAVAHDMTAHDATAREAAAEDGATREPVARDIRS